MMSDDTKTDTLTDFLLARIAEDEAVAKAAISEPWNRRVFSGTPGAPMVEETVVDDGVWHVDDSHEYQAERVTGKGIEIYDEGGHTVDQARHIARHDPARVLAECEAKRRIVEIHHRIKEAYPEPKEYCCSECSASGEYPGGWPCDTLAAVLAIYADHPDYRDEWRP